MTPERLRELLTYDPLTGAIRTKRFQRQLEADHDGLVIVFDSLEKKSFKMKLERVAYALAFGVSPREDKRVLHKNLDTKDNRLCNLALVSRKVYLQIKESHKNLTGGIRVIAHQSDQFAYLVYWFEGGFERKKIVQDIVPARKLQLKLQLKYSKILTKYCIFD
jgi:hypothetical protein